MLQGVGIASALSVHIYVRHRSVSAATSLGLGTISTFITRKAQDFAQ